MILRCKSLIFFLALGCGDKKQKSISDPDPRDSDVNKKPRALPMADFSFQTYDEKNPCYSVRGFFVDFARLYMPGVKLKIKSCLKQNANSSAKNKQYVCPANADCVFSEIHLTNESYTDIFYAFHRSGEVESCEIDPKSSNPLTTHLPNSVAWENGIRYEHDLMNDSLHNLTDTYCSFFGLKPNPSD